MTSIPATSAKPLYDAGTALYVRRSLEFAPHIQDLAGTLGIPSNSIECSFFCNPTNSVTLGHFDRSEVIVLQLRGRKTWRIAPNTFAPMPIDNWGFLDRVTSDVRLYASDAPPTTMPDGASSYALEAGSLLYVPRGYWHETITEEDALSFHINMTSLTRLDVLLVALRNELARDEWWRGPAYGLTAEEPGAIEEASAACAALRDGADRVNAQDLVRSSGRDGRIEAGTRFIRCGQAMFGIENLDQRTETAHVAIHAYHYRETTVTNLDVSFEFLPACRWIHGLMTGSTFDVSELIRVAPKLNLDDAKDLLSMLENARLVRRTRG
ncbi:cupin domain-containing protein [Pendulispora rubella]|uniref:Cupin domain-containing protein n=1 Tax=Pendulispora rubella TaxID=2741070 RepID=A0ABZ2KZ41_9BACT